VAGSARRAGCVDGGVGTAKFRCPRGIAVASGIAFVADTDNNAIRKVIISTGETSTLALTAVKGGSARELRAPFDLALALAGGLYVADRDQHAIRHVDAEGVLTTVVGALGQSGLCDGRTTEARLSCPYSVMVAPCGALFVADNNGAVRRVV